MKQIFKHDNLPWLTVLAGSAGLLMRIWLMGNVNAHGFLVRGHIAGILLLIFSLGVLAALFLATRALQQANKYRFNFPPSLAGGLFSMVAAVGFAAVSIIDLSGAKDPVTIVCCLLGVLTAACLVFTGYSRWRGLHPAPLFHTLICLYLIIRLVWLYRQWSINPQLNEYCYQLMATVFAMLACYHRAAFDANFGQRPAYAFYSLGCIYFCCLCMSGPEGTAPYLSLGLWLFTDLCSLKPMPRALREKKNEPAE